VNVCLNRVAAKKPAVEPIDDREPVDTRSESVNERLLRDERAAHVRAAIVRLPKKQRATLILRMYHEMAHKDIAEALGLSIGTVDRALHDRPGINALTRRRVLEMAESLGYKPNLAARFLKSHKQLALAVNLPRGVASFFDAVREGVRDAAAPFEMTVRVDFRSYPRLGDGDVKLFEDAVNDGADGLIIAPGNPAEMTPLIRRAAERKIPVVCVATDAPGAERLTAVSADPYTNGAIAAELLSRFRPPGRRAAVVTGCLHTIDHAEKLRGFRESLACLGEPLEIAQVLEAHDDPGEAFLGTTKLLESEPGLAAIYVSTSNSIPVLRALSNAGRTKGLAVVTTDVFPELLPHLRSGAVWATMYQRPLSQGRLAFDSLYRYLVEGKRPPDRIRLLPHVVMRSNLDLILEKLPIE
jgi:LacI family transcriptional regulator